MEEIKLLGAVELRAGGVSQELGSPKERCLLAILAVECGSVVSADTLAGRIWGERRPAQARTTLTSYVTRLRSRFRGRTGAEPGGPSPVESGHGGYRLTLHPESVDLHRFRGLRRQARAISESGDDEHAVALLAEAEELWGGEPLAGLTGDWIRALRESLEEERHGTRLERIDLQLRLGRHGEVIAELQRLTSERPMDERATAQLMTALYRLDRAADALEVYRRAARLLASEQGSDPGPRLRDLHERILRRDPDLGVTPRFLRGGGMPRPRSLPEAPAGFTGRVRELEVLTAPADAGAPQPMVDVVTGMGGIGKSALALRAAHILTGRFPDAALHVRLCGHDEARPPLSAGAVLTELLRALGVPPHRIPVSRVERTKLWRREMSGRRAIVVLDDAIGLDHIRPVIAGIPTCRVLVTSRRKLAGLPGARYLRLDVLPPGEARRLVVHVTGDGLGSDAVDEVVRRSGGHPLALRLAAAQAARAAETGADVHRGERHRLYRSAGATPDDSDELDEPVARAAFDRSYRDLTEEQQCLFRRLGWSPCPDITAEGAAALVARPTREVLAEFDVLIDHHLLHEQAPGRVRMHDIVRGFARARAFDEDSGGERRRVLSRLVHHYLRRADSADRVLYPHRRRRDLSEVRGNAPTSHDRDRVHDLVHPADAAAWLEREWRNCLALAEHSIKHEMKESGALLIHTLSQYLETQGEREDAGRGQEAAVRAARETCSPEALAQALFELSFTRFRTGDHKAALDHAAEALPIFRSLGDRAAEAETLDRIGIVLWTTARYREALAHHQEAQDLHRQADDAHGEADSLGYAAIVLWHLGRYGEALQHLEFSLAMLRRLGDRRREAMVLNNIGDVQRQRGFHRDAIRHYQESSAIFKKIGGVQQQAILNNNIGGVHQYKGDYTTALRFYREAITVFRDIGDRRNVADTLNSIGTTYLLMGHPGEALVHHQQAEDTAQEVGDRYQRVRALRGMADAHQSCCRYPVALDHYNRALAMARDISAPYQQAKVHEGIAATIFHLEGEQAARIHWRQALEIFEELGVPEAESIAIRLHTINEIAS
ncbi:AfsR/SARP family transcriptional regulator [Actinomadura rugatobispora]|uniref:Tetratricopeptide repeat protein n=1 Tax=Actinomadura rugatobispora TaxID=1994 RepID=A0ABW1AIZ5_9ACTN|nr:BTAD domain-containing putative transcriptional regulator [Actinomadura rugatobispora]